MAFRFFSSLRFRIIFLNLLILIPALIVIYHRDLEERRIIAQHIKKEQLQLVELISHQHNQLIESTRHLLYALAQLPQVRHGESSGSSHIFARLLKELPCYLNLGAADSHGNIFASALPLERPVNIADRPYFQQAFKAKRFAISDYHIGRITGQPSLILGHPFFDEKRVVKGVVYAALDLTQFNSLLLKINLPSGSSLNLIDKNGVILARYPEPEKWVGKSLKDLSLINTILAQKKGTTEEYGIDGLPRIFAFTSLGDTSAEGNVFISIGIPKKVAFAQIEKNTRRSLFILGFLSLLIILATWIGGDLLIVRPLRNLMGTIERIKDGDLSARVMKLSSLKEFSQLAISFNEMTQSLEKRELERKQAEDALRKSEEEAKKMAQENELVAKIGRIISSTLNIEEVYEGFAEEVKKLIPFDKISINIVDLDKKVVIIPFVAGKSVPERDARDVFPLAGSLTEEVFLKKRSVIFNPIDESHVTSRFPGYLPVYKSGLKSSLMVPLISRGEAMATLNFMSAS